MVKFKGDGSGRLPWQRRCDPMAVATLPVEWIDKHLNIGMWGMQPFHLRGHVTAMRRPDLPTGGGEASIHSSAPSISSTPQRQ